MSCVICGGITRPYLSVDFSHFDTSLKRGFYERCKECGFTYNVAAYDMDAAAWGELVCLIHSRWVERERDFVDERKVMGGNAPYFPMAGLINLLARLDMIDLSSPLDFAAGPARLANILDKLYNIALPAFEPFIKDESFSMYMEGSYSGEKNVQGNKPATFATSKGLGGLRACNTLQADCDKVKPAKHPKTNGGGGNLESCMMA